MVIIDKKSIEEMEEIAYFAYSIGATQFGVSPALNFGRNLLTFSSYFTPKFFLKIENLSRQFPKGFLGIIEGENIVEPIYNNCGTGSKSIVITPEKRVKPSAMFPKEFSGNALFLDSSLRFAFHNLISPRKSICKECEFLNYCAGCF